MQRLVLIMLFLVGCASSQTYIPGTRLPDVGDNREVVEVLEKYRDAVERADAPALLAMASRDYWEDGGTPKGDDDYGYDRLREVLMTRFQKASSIRYSVRYMGVRREEKKVLVDALVDASYTIQTSRGPQRFDMRDQNQYVLTKQGERWLFLSGM